MRDAEDDIMDVISGPEVNYDKLSRLHAMSPEHVSPLLTEVVESFSFNLNSPDSIN